MGRVLSAVAACQTWNEGGISKYENGLSSATGCY
jgi:hypothetical protein